DAATVPHEQPLLDKPFEQRERLKWDFLPARKPALGFLGIGVHSCQPRNEARAQQTIASRSVSGYRRRPSRFGEGRFHRRFDRAAHAAQGFVVVEEQLAVTTVLHEEPL